MTPGIVWSEQGEMMAEGAVRIVERFWELMGSNNFSAVGEVLTDTFVLEWPQSGERIRGRDAFAAMNQDYPAHGRWTFAMNQIVGGENAAASDVFVTDGVQAARAVTFFAVNDGKIDAIVEFWPEPFEAPANRRHLVEPIEPAISPPTAEP